MNRILVTGGAGFVGSNIAFALKEHYPDMQVLVLDNLLRRGSERNVALLEARGIKFIHGDVRVRSDLNQAGKIDFLFECSAEPSVLAGADGNPAYVIDTNLGGALNCADYCRQQEAGMIFLSTSRVYSIEALSNLSFSETASRFVLDDRQTAAGASAAGVSEDFSVQGFKSFYGASKYAAEVMLEEYRQMFGQPIIINRCGLLSGPGQFGKADQGIISFWIDSFRQNKPLKYIGFNGMGKQVRDALHINDLISLLFKQLQNPQRFNRGVFNVGGGSEVSFSLLELSQICREISGVKINVASEPEMRYADIPVYISDTAKIKALCDWKIENSVEEIVNDVYNWLKGT